MGQWCQRWPSCSIVSFAPYSLLASCFPSCLSRLWWSTEWRKNKSITSLTTTSTDSNDKAGSGATPRMRMKSNNSEDAKIDVKVLPSFSFLPVPSSYWRKASRWKGKEEEEKEIHEKDDSTWRMREGDGKKEALLLLKPSSTPLFAPNSEKSSSLQRLFSCPTSSFFSFSSSRMTYTTNHMSGIDFHAIDHNVPLGCWRGRMIFVMASTASMAPMMTPTIGCLPPQVRPYFTRTTLLQKSTCNRRSSGGGPQSKRKATGSVDGSGERKKMLKRRKSKGKSKRRGSVGKGKKKGRLQKKASKMFRSSASATRRHRHHLHPLRRVRRLLRRSIHTSKSLHTDSRMVRRGNHRIRNLNRKTSRSLSRHSSVKKINGKNTVNRKRNERMRLWRERHARRLLRHMSEKKRNQLRVSLLRFLPHRKRQALLLLQKKMGTRGKSYSLREKKGLMSTLLRGPKKHKHFRRPTPLRTRKTHVSTTTVTSTTGARKGKKTSPSLRSRYVRGKWKVHQLDKKRVRGGRGRHKVKTAITTTTPPPGWMRTRTTGVRMVNRPSHGTLPPSSFVPSVSPLSPSSSSSSSSSGATAALVAVGSSSSSTTAALSRFPKRPAPRSSSSSRRKRSSPVLVVRISKRGRVGVKGSKKHSPSSSSILVSRNRLKRKGNRVGGRSVRSEQRTSLSIRSSGAVGVGRWKRLKMIMKNRKRHPLRFKKKNEGKRGKSHEGMLKKNPSNTNRRKSSTYSQKKNNMDRPKRKKSGKRKGKVSVGRRWRRLLSIRASAPLGMEKKRKLMMRMIPRRKLRGHQLQKVKYNKRVAAIARLWRAKQKHTKRQQQLQQQQQQTPTSSSSLHINPYFDVFKR